MTANLKKLLLRTTSYKGYGLGHLKRSILLANKITEIYRNKVEVMIAIEGDKESFDIVKKSNIEYIELTIGIDLKEELKNYNQKNINIFILDVFDRNDISEKEYKNVADYLVTFSDMGEPSIYSDIVICPQLLPYSIKQSHDEQIVLEGPNYFIFDNSYLSNVKKNKSFNEKRYSIFVCLGGYSNDKVLKVICSALTSNINIFDNIIFITGYDCSIDVRTIIKKNHLNIEIIEYCDNPLKYLAKSDFAIISGGHIKYEAAALGVPSIIIGLVEHQDILSKIFEKTGSCIYLGTADSVSPQKVLDGIDKLTLNDDRLISMSESARDIVDGYGAERVVKAIFSLH